ncbi:MAG: hypothetical protein OEY55_13285 [Acidimicrobiia bacterium]|nr:hypothetical protein [Acidimicrobiia bacterium]MDH5422770.1 hypothetical protein [Acidimicrobiia bacterium]MDH5504377.1 hypothetical protein [Acidimicrobiia bacterium]
MEVNCAVGDQEFERFLDGTSDDLVDHVGECPTCQARMEGSLEAAGLLDIEQTMRAIRIHSFGKVALETAMDVGTRFARSTLHYLLKG